MNSLNSTKRRTLYRLLLETLLSGCVLLFAVPLKAMKIQLKLIDKERKKLTEELKEMEKYGDKEIEIEFRELMKVQGRPHLKNIAE
jgi:hypothetical protein